MERHLAVEQQPPPRRGPERAPAHRVAVEIAGLGERHAIGEGDPLRAMGDHRQRGEDVAAVERRAAPEEVGEVARLQAVGTAWHPLRQVDLGEVPLDLPPGGGKLGAGGRRHGRQIALAERAYQGVAVGRLPAGGPEQRRQQYQRHQRTRVVPPAAARHPHRRRGAAGSKERQGQDGVIVARRRRQQERRATTGQSLPGADSRPRLPRRQRQTAGGGREQGHPQGRAPAAVAACEVEGTEAVLEGRYQARQRHRHRAPERGGGDGAPRPASPAPARRGHRQTHQQQPQRRGGGTASRTGCHRRRDYQGRHRPRALRGRNGGLPQDRQRHRPHGGKRQQSESQGSASHHRRETRCRRRNPDERLHDHRRGLGRRKLPRARRRLGGAVDQRPPKRLCREPAGRRERQARGLEAAAGHDPPGPRVRRQRLHHHQRRRAEGSPVRKPLARQLLGPRLVEQTASFPHQRLAVGIDQQEGEIRVGVGEQGREAPVSGQPAGVIGGRLSQGPRRVAGVPRDVAPEGRIARRGGGAPGAPVGSRQAQGYPRRGEGERRERQQRCRRQHLATRRAPPPPEGEQEGEEEGAGQRRQH